MKILAIIPSIYPEKLMRALESFNLTKSKHIDISIQTEGTVTEAMNRGFNDNPNYDFYFQGNDDIIFRTPLWDMKLAKKGKITYGNDTIQGENLCTFPMIDGDIVRALGWIQYPEFDHGYCNDNMWKLMGEQCGILEYMEDVILEHEWDGKMDAAKFESDRAIFARWLPFSFRDITKIRSVLL